jgi:tetratricopeptide (TPR) repeat protein
MGDRGPLRDFVVRWRKSLVLALAVATGTLVGLVVFEPLSRPIETSQQRKQYGLDSSGSVRNTASSAPVTAEGLTDEANQIAQRLLERFPGSPQALTLAGSIYYAFGDQAAADRCWEESLSIDPDFAPTSQRMGEAAWERGQYDRATSHLLKAIETDPSLTPAVAFLLADSLMNTGSPQEAVDALEQADAQGPLSVDATFLLGYGYLQTGQHDKAKDCFAAGLLIDPTSSKIHFGLATVYARLGQAEESRKHREEYAKLKAQKLDQTTSQRSSLRSTELGDMRPFAVQTLVNAGTIHASHGDLRQAEEYWVRAAQLDPQHREATRWLELLYAGGSDGKKPF